MVRCCLSTDVKNRFGSRRASVLGSFLLQQFPRYGPQFFGMLAKIGEHALFFLLSPVLGERIRLFVAGNEFRLARGYAIVNHAPCLLDRKKRDAQLVTQFLVGSALERRRQEPLFTSAKAELRRCVEKKRADP